MKARKKLKAVILQEVYSGAAFAVLMGGLLAVLSGTLPVA